MRAIALCSTRYFQEVEFDEVVEAMIKTKTAKDLDASGVCIDDVLTQTCV